MNKLPCLFGHHNFTRLIRMGNNHCQYEGRICTDCNKVMDVRTLPGDFQWTYKIIKETPEYILIGSNDWRTSPNFGKIVKCTNSYVLNDLISEFRVVGIEQIHKLIPEVDPKNKDTWFWLE